jgi:hypothetical protein
MSYLIEAKKKILVLLNSREALLCGGGAKDYAEYKWITGEISGLNRAIQEIDDLQKRIDRNNGDLDEDSSG